MSDTGGWAGDTYLKRILDGHLALWRLSRDFDLGSRGVDLNFISSVRHLAFFEGVMCDVFVRSR